MSVIAWVLVAAAGLLHVYIFMLETLWIGRASTRALFGIRSQDLEIVRPWAFNQGFYNLFLGVGALGGVVLKVFGPTTAAVTLGGFCCASMFAAALVLGSSDRSKLAAAIKQGSVPGLALLALLVLGV